LLFDKLQIGLFPPSTHYVEWDTATEKHGERYVDLSAMPILLTDKVMARGSAIYRSLLGFILQK
jgi:hypothetical protein